MGARTLLAHRTLLAVSAIAVLTSAVFAQETIEPYGDADPKDLRISKTINGALMPFRGWAVWQAAAYCSAAFVEEEARVRKLGQTATADMLKMVEKDRFYMRGMGLLEKSRAITLERAVQIMDSATVPFISDGVDYQQALRPCAQLATTTGNSLPPALLAAAPSDAPKPAIANTTPAPARKPLERRFKSQAALTRPYDGRPYWELMLRCYAGWKSGPGQAPQMATRFMRVSGQLLQREMLLDQAAAEAKARAAIGGLAPITPVDVRPEADPCLAIGRQMEAEAPKP